MRVALLTVGCILAFLAGAACIMGGVALLMVESWSAARSDGVKTGIPEEVAHGIGIYCIGKGLAIWAVTTFRLGKLAPAAAPPARRPIAGLIDQP